MIQCSPALPFPQQLIVPTTALEADSSYSAAMHRRFIFFTISSLVAASVIQHPLVEPADSQTLINTKPLVSSNAIQDDISSNKLLERAKHLYKLAELAAEEYNHPTRVIGSKGKLCYLLYCLSVPIKTALTHLQRASCYYRLHLLDTRRSRGLL